MKRKLGGRFPADFFSYNEVLVGGEHDLLFCNKDSPYSYSYGLERDLLAAGMTPAEVDMVKIWYSMYPLQVDGDCGSLSMKRKVIENDDSDQQQQGSTSRDMQGHGSVLVIEKDIAKHRHFEKKLFLDPNGASDNDNDFPIRLVLSSFWLPQNPNDYGFPDGLSRCAMCTVDCSTCDPARSMNYSKAHQTGVPGYTGNMVGGLYTRPHRDLEIINAMRSWVHLAPLNNTDLEGL